jgi:hypothetical protein
VEAIYKAIIQREAVESIERQRSTMIAALFSNPTWDDEKNDRTTRIQELNRQFNDAIELVYNPRPKHDVDWQNPFYAAAKRGLQKTREKYAWAIDGKEMQEAMSPSDQEQLRVREEGRRAIDQS